MRAWKEGGERSLAREHVWRADALEKSMPPKLSGSGTVQDASFPHHQSAGPTSVATLSGTDAGGGGPGCIHDVAKTTTTLYPYSLKVLVDFETRDCASRLLPRLVLPPRSSKGGRPTAWRSPRHRRGRARPPHPPTCQECPTRSPLLDVR